MSAFSDQPALAARGQKYGQSFGGYDLRVYGIDMVLSIIDAVGAKSWEDLVGRNCRVRGTGRELTAIGHILEDRWYSPKK